MSPTQGREWLVACGRAFPDQHGVSEPSQRMQTHPSTELSSANFLTDVHHTVADRSASALLVEPLSQLREMWARSAATFIHDSALADLRAVNNQG